MKYPAADIADPTGKRLTAWLTINRACNLRCQWCYAQMTGFEHKDDMSLQLVDQSIEFLHGMSMKSVILIGGEPTIHPHFFEIVQRIKQADMAAYVVTNAIKFSSKGFLDRAIDAGVASITVSLKASNRRDFLEATGRDSFIRTMKAIGNISESGIPSVVNVTLSESLLGRFDEMISAVRESGAVAFSVDSGKPVLFGGKTNMDGMGTPERLVEFFMEVYPKLKRSGLRFSLKIALPFCLFPKEFIEEIMEDGNVLTGCQMVSGRGIIIDPSGRLIPCNHMCDQSIGTIGEDFVDAQGFVSHRKQESVIRFYRTVSSAPHRNCLDCSYWRACGAGCKLYWLHYGSESLIGNFK